jgi:adenylate cyclase class 2
MSIEVEAKFPVKNISEVEEKVKKFAEFVIDKVEEDIYFKSPVRDFAVTDEALRVRKDVEGVVVTYKGAKLDSETKTREEVKARIDPGDYDKIIMILLKLGFEDFAVVKKRRKIYRYEDAVICLDSLEIGDFIEIEVEGSDVEYGKRRIFEIASRLGIDKRESIRKSYLELILEKTES